MSERFNFFSEIAFSADGGPRPLHILRTGTFTASSGFTFSFEPDHIRAIVANFEAGKRRKPPITERHDFGRAVGRIAKVWCDADATNLYAQPSWNKDGKALLSDEVYDGFSCELDDLTNNPFLIGGSLTNYPAVGGLEPVTLSAPPLHESENAAPVVEETQTIDTPPPPALPALPQAQPEHISQPHQGEPPMSDTPVVELSAPQLPPINDPALQSRLDALLAQREATLEQQQRSFEARVNAEFERRLLETEQRNTIRAFAQSRTMTTPDQPYAIPGTSSELEQLLLETPAQVRGKWQALLTRICTAGAVSFDEIGSSGEGAGDTDRWQILVNAKVAAGLSRVAAIQAVGREHPDLYAAQAKSKKGGR